MSIHSDLKTQSVPAYLWAMLILLMCTLVMAPARAGSVNTDGAGLAIKGYDVVAYFTQSSAVPGKAEISHEWGGATWLFDSQANRDLFMAEPTRFVPQYGGYCAYAAAQGALADIDPMAWTIHDDRLYLNFNLQVRELWSDDRAALIERADANWPSLAD